MLYYRQSEGLVVGRSLVRLPSDFFTLRLGDSLALLLVWTAEDYCVEVFARSTEISS